MHKNFNMVTEVIEAVKTMNVSSLAKYHMSERERERESPSSLENNYIVFILYKIIHS